MKSKQSGEAKPAKKGTRPYRGFLRHVPVGKFFPDIDLFLSSLKSRNTFTAYDQAFRWFVKDMLALKVESVHALTRESIQTLFQTWKEADVPAATLAARAAALRTICQWYVEKGVIPFSPVPQRLATVTQKSPTKLITMGEFQALLGIIDRENLKGKRDYALLCTVFFTCSRVGDVLQLKCRDYSRRDGKPFLRFEHRLLSIDKDLVEALDLYIGELDPNHRQGDLPLFQAMSRVGTSSGHVLLANNLKMALDEHARRAGIPHITVDQIRRLGLHLYIQEHGLEKARQMAGHTHLKSTVQFL